MFLDANVLKIDTDGHDFAVISGAKKLLSNSQPVVLFECDVFKNSNYVTDCLNVMKLFESAGYTGFILYDNYGYLMGRFMLDDLSAFRRLIFYQLKNKFCYFDILMMTDRDLYSFYQREIDFFTKSVLNTDRQNTALVSAQ